MIKKYEFEIPCTGKVKTLKWPAESIKPGSVDDIPRKLIQTNIIFFIKKHLQRKVISHQGKFRTKKITRKTHNKKDFIPLQSARHQPNHMSNEFHTRAHAHRK